MIDMNFCEYNTFLTIGIFLMLVYIILRLRWYKDLEFK